MTNRFKGEVPLQVGERTYTVRFTTNALVELEELLDMSVNKIAQQMANPDTMRVKMVVAVLWAGLRDHHPDITQAQASEIITDVSLIKAMEAVSAAFVLTFGEKSEDVPTHPGKKSPVMKQVGTGKLS